MSTLNERIWILEDKLQRLITQLNNQQQNSDKIDQPPRTSLGGSKIVDISHPIDSSSGRGAMSGGAVLWNNTEINAPYGTQPNIPEIGYNRHSHSRFSGGALIKDALEIVDYDWGTITNKHSQSFLKSEDAPKIKTDLNINGENVDKIGLLDVVFNPDTGTWGTSAYEIDVKKCYLVIRDENGDIELDSKGQEKKSLLYNEDTTKTSVVWDENGKCWRFFAVYAPGS